MIYELLCQAPNSFITCFLKESSKEQSVCCWVIAHCQHSFPWFMKLENPNATQWTSGRAAFPSQRISWLRIAEGLHKYLICYNFCMHKIKNTHSIHSEVFPCCNPWCTQWPDGSWWCVPRSSPVRLPAIKKHPSPPTQTPFVGASSLLSPMCVLISPINFTHELFPSLTIYPSCPPK